MKPIKEQKLIRSQAGRKFESLKEFSEGVKGVTSWTKYVRLALGMSIGQLAGRLGLSPNTVSEAEAREIEGRLTINKLKEMANAMECDLIYAFVPRKQLKDLVYKQAKKKVLTNMQHAETHMELEGQKVSDQCERIEGLIEEKMYSKYLWDKNGDEN
ncbi:MAG: helix-turn-helix domain-containing protein [Bdellovibrio sp.]|nr:helix-turn-helix domain-containing protein [Bdellovibrio sp.]